MKMYRYFAFFFVVLFLGLGVSFFFRSKDIVIRESYKVLRKDIKETLMLKGRIDFFVKKEFKLSANAFLREFFVHEGQDVKKDQLLLKLESPDLKVRLDEVQAKWQVASLKLKKIKEGLDSVQRMELENIFSLAKTKLEKLQAEKDYQKNLYDKGHNSKEDWETFEQQLVQSENEYKIAEEKMRLGQGASDPAEVKLSEAEEALARKEYDKVQMEYDLLELKAPFDGRIFHLGIDEKSINKELEKETILFMIADVTQEVLVYSDVFESQAPRLKKGLLGSLHWVGAQKSYDLKLDQIHDVADQTSGIPKYPVVFVVQETISENIRLGALVDVEVLIGQIEDAIAVPLRLIAWQGQQEGVWKQKGKSFVFCPIQTDIRNTEFVHVVSGLNEGDIIYVE